MTTEVIVAIIVAVFASTGFWSFLSSRFQRRDKKKDTTDDLQKKDTEIEGEIDDLKEAIEALQSLNTLQSEMLRGIGHDRIIFLGEHYLRQKYITPEEYENLHDYLYKPYRALGGNGTAEKIMNEVMRLPSEPPESGGEHHE